MKNVITWPELNIQVFLEVSSHRMHFDVYNVWIDENEEVSFEAKDGASPFDRTTDTSQALCFMSGSIKWDGCLNLEFPEQNHVMLHFCGRPHSKIIDTVLGKLYALAAEQIPNADPKLMLE